MTNQRYIEYLQSDEWARKRDRILRRDRNRCRKCGSPADDVHHKTYERIYCEDDDDLISICRTCHRYEHKLLEPREAARQANRIEAHCLRQFRKMYGP
jgi:5-methylcytosine-specific restriction endonuclease McrA